jgi:hypothetical protein
MDRMRTKRDTPRSFLDVEANARFEPLALFVDERDERDGSFTNASRKVGEIVEFLFWGRVEYAVGIQRGDALGLVARGTWNYHT